MPRRNFWLLAMLVVVCLACHVRTNRYAQVFSYAMDQIHGRYLEPIQRRRLLEGALEGMMHELGDPHSVYIRPKAVEAFEESLDQRFGGVGLEIILDETTKQLTVASPLFGAPAYEAGIRPRDRILRIDGRSTQGLSLDDAAELMRGKPGTAVVLTVQHEGETDPVEIRVVRAQVQVATVLGDTRNPDGSWNYWLEGHDRIGYVRIHLFGERTATELDEVVRHLVERGHRRIAALTWPPESRVGANRIAGFLQGLIEAGIPPVPEWMERGEGVPAFGYQATLRLLALPESMRPTAIVAFNDAMALGAVRAAQQLGYRVGSEIAITGFDDTPLARYTIPPLTSVRQPIWEVGDRLVNRLITLLDHPDISSPYCELIEPELIIRASSTGEEIPLDQDHPYLYP